MTSQADYTVVNRFVDHDFLLAFNTCDIVFFNSFVVISVFRFVHNGGPPISTARERVMGLMTSPIDCATTILYRYSADTFRLSLTVRKLYVVFVKRWIWLGFPLWGCFPQFSTPKRHQTVMKLLFWCALPIRAFWAITRRDMFFRCADIMKMFKLEIPIPALKFMNF